MPNHPPAPANIPASSNLTACALANRPHGFCNPTWKQINIHHVLWPVSCGQRANSRQAAASDECQGALVISGQPVAGRPAQVAGNILERGPQSRPLQAAENYTTKDEPRLS
ncbi:hypothetical protein RRG08_023364 [Elysia crispata]|uniref:Uncharacterized protein n=1 Tax=Elysia crispata TaxID=231223 RepID=A0AAE1BCA8_9GAST|nr:hypothetical protein RRG08_023364 [Elysia crispata]